MLYAHASFRARHMEHLSELWHCSGLRTFLGVYKINLIMCILACFVWLVTRACRSAAATSCAQSDCACTTGGGATSERVACFSTQCTRMGGLAAVVCSFNLYVFLYQSNQVFTTALKFISATPYSHVATERIGYSVLVCLLAGCGSTARWESIQLCVCASAEMPFPSTAHLDTPILVGREQSLPRSTTSVSENGDYTEMDPGSSFVGQSTPRSMHP